MSANRIEGAAKKASGAIKEAAGKATGNDRLRAKGAAEKAVGDGSKQGRQGAGQGGRRPSALTSARKASRPGAPP